jgi:dipeptidyl aminopeptidase/acylaminoacyl peptidase
VIPRAQLFGNPKRAAPGMSPDGLWLSWAAASQGGVMNVWVARLDDLTAARQVTDERHRGVTAHSWAFDSAHILFTQDRDGDENHQLFSVNAQTGERRALSPEGCRCGIVALSRQRRSEALISLNRRDRRYADLYVLDITSGDLRLHAENPGFLGFVIGDDFDVRFASRPTADGGLELLRRTPEGDWEPWDRFESEDARNSGISHLDRSGRFVYMHDSRGRDTAALIEVDLLQPSVRSVLAEDALADIGSVLNDRETLRPVLYGVHYERPTRHLLDPRFQPDVAFLDEKDLGSWWPAARAEDDSRWIVGASSDRDPGSYYLYDRPAQTLTRFFDLRPELVGQPLARMQSTTLISRDGLPMVCYISLPPASDTGLPLSTRMPVPMVVYVHGGPWARDSFGYNTTHQWLCDRGYAVLNVNFRSSTGFGKALLNAGNGEWGRKMDDDIDDAVDWAIAHGIADPARIAIVGMSYGGYAVLSGLTRRPGRYACGVDIVGPSNLETLMQAIPPQWEAGRQTLYRAIGNPQTPEGIALLRERSPLHRAGAIRDPLLIAQGANDPRVRKSESDQMVQALVDRGIPVTYAMFPDEGHGFRREPNRLVFNALMEAFLARHLGGRCEPFLPTDYPGNSLQILQGAS